jgi:cytochrome b subunit of formate dehydrogenase
MQVPSSSMSRHILLLTRTAILVGMALPVHLPASALAQSSADCLICHSNRSLTTVESGRAVSLYVDETTLKHSAHGSLACVDCHTGLNPEKTPHANPVPPVNCGMCHDVKRYEESIHAQAGVTCTDCHGTHDILPPGNPSSTVAPGNLAKTCGRCHSQVASRYVLSAHGRALASGFKYAPSCIDCHGAHKVEPITSRLSPVYKQYESRVCLRCHVDNPAVRNRVGVSAGFIAGFENSIHGLKVAAGDQKAATCSDCHGSHSMEGASNPTSRVYKQNIPEACGRCHQAIAVVYGRSIHGSSLRQGHLSAPACTDCHGQHQIFAPENPLSRVAPRNVSSKVCGVCHSSVILEMKYSIPAERFKTFEDSYHGLALREGNFEVANCASCHGHHDILPSSNPASRINKRNLAATCGQCHKGATEKFAVGPPVHSRPGERRGTLLYWIRRFYLSLIALIAGGMFLYNTLDFIKKSRVHLAVRRGLIPRPPSGTALYLRMSLWERLQHGLLTVSFVVLVITGFMLKFPDAWWVAPIRSWSSRLFEVRSITHRVAGSVLIATSLAHICYVLFVRRGKELIRDLAPKSADVRDAWRSLLYNAGISKSKPRLGRFGYVEKIEYWALVWGTVIMASTGIILWFNTFFINILSKLGWDAARLIHYYEAWLATLAIILWHFYYVIFNPDVYPMNTAWWNGMMSEEEMAEEHPLELELIRAERPSDGGD